MRLAVTVAVVFDVTDAAVVVKLAVCMPAGTVTEAGTESEVLLSAKLTEVLALGAAVRLTVQLAEPGVAIVDGLHAKVLTCGKVDWVTETAPPEPEEVNDAAFGKLATVLATWMPRVGDELDEEIVKLATATTPFAIVSAFSPNNTHVDVPED